MYKEYFGLKEPPFSIAPDPRYLYMSEQHREALAHLVYGFNSDGGFVLLTGEIGTGKTTVCRCLLEKIPENTAIAFLFNPKLTVDELLATICDEFGISYPDKNTSIKVFVDLINDFLLSAHAGGRKTVLIIDEAQNLSADVLEQLRLLTNLETSQKKLLQIILLGQPELREKLSRPDLHQLSQRVIARYHLGSLSRDDVKAYVSHRLSVAGVQSTLFPDSALNTLYALTGGVPRLMNIICDRALLGAFVTEQSKITSSLLKKAAAEVSGTDTRTGNFKKILAWTPIVLVFIVFGVVLATNYYQTGKSPTPPDQAVEQAAQDLAISEIPEKERTGQTEMMPLAIQKDKAYEALFRQWQISYTSDVDGPACSHAESKGLQCLRLKGPFDELFHLNRPAVLKLYDSSGQEYYGALTALSGQDATVTVGAETRTLPVRDIQSQWAGEYTLFWKPPPGFRENIKTGYAGDVVRWLDTQLARIHDRDLSFDSSATYTETLAAEIKTFQGAEGLNQDGIVGALTIIHMNTLTDHEVPLLITRNTRE